MLGQPPGFNYTAAVPLLKDSRQVAESCTNRT